MSPRRRESKGGKERRESERDAPRFVVPDWPVLGRVRALVAERTGGVSMGAFESLNLGALGDDDPERVAENRRRLRAAAALPAEPVWLRQVHGTDVAELDAGSASSIRSNVSAETPAPAEPRAAPRRDFGAARSRADLIEADAAVTGARGVVCAVLTADCLPVFLAARDGTRVGIAHAGWRGLAAGVLERAVAAMRTPPAELVAWLGPAIGPAAFEVGEDVVVAFGAAGYDTGAAMRANARGRWQADLYALARESLGRAGLREILGGGFCTYAESARFFSHRREGPCGRFASLIWLE